MYKRLYTFPSDFHILFDSQFGFRSKHSTDHHLNSSLTQKVSSLGVCIDLSKAFDTSVILSKSDHYGIRGISLQWFADYLHNRKQFTFINITYSNFLTINHGVPQGSILRPPLFLLYVNDLHHSSSLLYFTLFADDTTILYSHSGPTVLVNTLISELHRVSTWFRVNKLSLNSIKTNYMIFSRSKKFTSSSEITISMDHTHLIKVHTTKFLGVTIDDKFTWSDHISSISKTISHNVGVLSKLCSSLPPATTLISPYLTYRHCNIIWARACTTKFNSLSIIQKRAIRICTFSPPRAHTAPLFAQLNTLTLKDINKLITGNFMYKCVTGLLPRTFTSYFTSVHDTHNHHTRSHNNLFLPFIHTSYYIHTLRHYYMDHDFGILLTCRSRVNIQSANRLDFQYMTMDMTQLSYFVP